jgi:hypothetical protein
MICRSNAIILAVGLAALSVATGVQAAHRTHTGAHRAHAGMHRMPYASDQPSSYGPPHGFLDDWYHRYRPCVPVGPNAVQCGGVRWEYHGGTLGL